ncbi:ferritin heavy chain-like protein [Leptotrombidium deliense]|uniref:Ferritin n=1 Tax=Leptotrombidium deliense TaxID=299467 RepID=A0A443SQW4_9ACAR|nr:ferritin heavy chain-like protein [Leptotrombidium deliense]
MKVIFAFALLCAGLNTLAQVDLDPPKGDRYKMSQTCVDLLQQQVNMELHASLVYLNMAAHFDNTDIARKGFTKFFKHSSDEEKQHAQKLIDYINRRGGKLRLWNVEMPNKDTWTDALSALRDALDLETRVTNELHVIHHKAETICRDPHLMDFLETEFLQEQIDSISELRRLITTLSQMNSGMGEYFVDRQLLDKKDEL